MLHMMSVQCRVLGICFSKVCDWLQSFFVTIYLRAGACMVCVCVCVCAVCIAGCGMYVVEGAHRCGCLGCGGTEGALGWVVQGCVCG